MLARLRRKWGGLVLALPIILVVLVDLNIRGDRLLGLSPKYFASYAAAMAESAILWGLLLFAASSRRGVFRWLATALFVTLGTLAVGAQIYFHRQYSTYLNLDATLFGTSFTESLLGQIKADAKNLATAILPPALFTALLVVLGRRLVRPSRSIPSRALRYAAPAAVLAAGLIPCSYRRVQASTPDVIYFHAIGGLVKQLSSSRTTGQIRPGVRTPPQLPAIARAPSPKPRNVLFILTESVRADAHCSAHQASCPVAPRTNEAAPDRIPLLQMRSNSSTTAIQLAVIWSGLEPVAGREALHTSPLVFDYAKAAGIENAYWTSHHMMFANSRLYVQDLPTKHQCGATDLDPLADIDLGGRDDLLTERIEREIVDMHEPFFGVAHFGNTHVPYLVDPNDAPFQPSLPSKDPSDNEAYRNYYKNAVYRQDKAIARLIRFVRSQPFGDRTVIVFTSDHGEAFREHGQICHTGAILDEEIHVPFWVDAPPGTLTDAERDKLKAQRDVPSFHTDMAPTVLDLMGLWDAPEVQAFKQKMPGGSLLRDRGEPTLALSNCSGIWGCAFPNWGMMRGKMKLEGRERDDAWHCYDVIADPAEKHDLGPAACGDLLPKANALYGGPPGLTDVKIQ